MIVFFLAWLPAARHTAEDPPHSEVLSFAVVQSLMHVRN